MKKFSKSILTISLTTSMMIDSFLLTQVQKVSADTFTSSTQSNQSTPLKLYKASEVNNTDIQLVASSTKDTTNFDDSLQNTINKTEA
ncbi:hypothetical protein RD055328_12920 [Companilactobacillus sp. RD055328]|uniref:hypothetical protein n=1 Tax=Companilactobacillus sp. RD055328 TaxID=2916634 RepID=UPI001FC7E858|nr:hypothetical protein [Companilactobacillus sp. RD055328]GKQ43369.1 hypothetical protein RD055328_12920 [Companilactobacillus sp. RD055328]